MKIIDSIIKRMTNPDRFLAASMHIIEGAGILGEKPHPFSYAAAVKVYMVNPWVYRAVMLNANTAARVPMRLYVRAETVGGVTYNPRTGRRLALAHRRVSESRKRWLRGDLSSRPSDAVQRKAIEMDQDFVEVTDSTPIMELLRKVDPHVTGFGLSVYNFTMLQVVGACYMHPVWSDELNRPVQLWPMFPQYMKVIPAARDSGQLIDGYAYGVDSAALQRFEPDEVLAIKRMHPDSMFYGLGDLEAAWHAIGRYSAEATMTKALYDNNARMDSLLIGKNVKDQSQLDQMSAMINQKFRGPRNAGKTMALAGDWDYRPLSFSPRELRRDERMIEEILAATGVPRDKLLGNATFANGENADEMWLRDTIVPLLTTYERGLNDIEGGYLSMFRGGELSEDAFIAFDNPVPEDVKDDTTRITALVAGGLMTANEARLELGFDEIDGGDRLRVGGIELGAQPSGGLGDIFGLAPIKGVVNEEEAHRNGGVAHGTVADDIHARAHTKGSGHDGCGCKANAASRDEQRPDETGNSNADAWSVKSFDGSMPMSFKADSDDDIRRGEAEARIAAMRKAVEKEMRQANAKITAIIAGADKIGAGEVARIEKLVDAMARSIANAIADQMLFVIESGVNVGVGQVGITLGSSGIDVTKISERLLAGYTEQIKTQLTKTTIDALRSSLADGVGKGESVGQLAQRVRDGGVFDPARAETIARSESARAFVDSKIETWKESGVVTGKRWNLAPGACEFCRAAAAAFNEKSTPLGEPFYKLGATISGADGGTMKVGYADVQGPPLHPNDRCDVSPILQGENE